MADNVQQIHVFTSSETAASNALVTKGPILVHKVVMQNTNGSNAVSVLLYDAATATGTEKIGLTTNAVAAASANFEQYREANFDPPVRFQVGFSSTIAGANPTCRVYYSR
jgi:hypothetical protein